MATIFRAPFFVSTTAPYYRPRVTPVPNLLTTTLWPGTPFTQTDWPIPARPQAIRVESPPTLLGTTISARTDPFDLLDWPRATGPLFRPGEQAQNLFNTAVTSRTDPFEQLDWPIPARPRLRPDDQTQNLLGTAATSRSSPFAQTDWVRGVTTSVRLAIDAPPNFLLGILGVPFTSSTGLLGWGQQPGRIGDLLPNLLTTTLIPVSAGTPFSQLLWFGVAPALRYQHDFISNLLPLQVAPPTRPGPEAPVLGVTWSPPPAQLGQVWG